MSDMNELKKYEIAGRALEQMMSDNKEESSKLVEENKEVSLGQSLKNILGEALLKEMGPFPDQERDYYPGCPDGVKRTQKLVSFIGKLINDYMGLFYMGNHDDYKDSDLDDMMGSSLRLIIAAAIGKLQIAWNEKDEPKEISADPHEGDVKIEIIPQDEVKSPTGEMYVVVEVIGDDVKLTNKISNEDYMIKKEIFKKWKLNS